MLARCWLENRSVSFICCILYFGDLLKLANMAFVGNKTFISLWFECFLSLSHSLQRGNCNRRGDFKVTCRVLADAQVPVSNNFGFSRPWMTRNSTLLIWKELSIAPWNSLTAPWLQTENVDSSSHHQKIPRRNSIYSRKREVKIVYHFFQGNTSRRFLNFLLFHLPVFWL